MKVIEDLSEFHSTKQKILKKLAREGEELSGLGQIAKEIDRAESTTSGHLADLSQTPYLKEEKMGRKKNWEVTERGKDLVLQSPLTPDSPNSDRGVTDKTRDGSQFSLHNFSGKVKIQNVELLQDDWKERFIERSERNWTHDETNDTYYTYVKGFKVRITGEAVVIMLDDELKDSTPEIVKNRGIRKLSEARKWIDDNLLPEPVSLKDRVKLTIQVSTQHIARVKDPICRFIKEREGWNLSDVEVEDSSGTVRMWFDDSHGEEHRETGNSPGQNRNDAEDDQEKVERMLQGLIEDDYSHGDFQWLSDFNDKSPERRMKVMEQGLMALIFKSLGSENSGCSCCHCENKEDSGSSDLEDRLDRVQGKFSEGSGMDVEELSARMKARMRKIRSEQDEGGGDGWEGL